MRSKPARPGDCKQPGCHHLAPWGRSQHPLCMCSIWVWHLCTNRADHLVASRLYWRQNHRCSWTSDNCQSSWNTPPNFHRIAWLDEKGLSERISCYWYPIGRLHSSYFVQMRELRWSRRWQRWRDSWWIVDDSAVHLETAVMLNRIVRVAAKANRIFYTRRCSKRISFINGALLRHYRTKRMTISKFESFRMTEMCAITTTARGTNGWNAQDEDSLQLHDCYCPSRRNDLHVIIVIVTVTVWQPIPL